MPSTSAQHYIQYLMWCQNISDEIGFEEGFYTFLSSHLNKDMYCWINNRMVLSISFHSIISLFFQAALYYLLLFFYFKCFYSQNCMLHYFVSWEWCTFQIVMEQGNICNYCIMNTHHWFLIARFLRLNQFYFFSVIILYFIDRFQYNSHKTCIRLYTPLSYTPFARFSTSS